MRETTSSAARFGTFAGVFTPNILTILGIILFLRMGWVVGQAGLWGALIIVLLANTISLLTGLSLSVIATNMQVKGGGNYYLISRSLGLEVGGAIGIPLYLSQAISVAFYIIGFTEALRSLEFFATIDPRLIATTVAVLFVFIAYIGADFALRIQYFILAVLIAALVSFFSSGLDLSMTPNTGTNFTEGVTFWVVFAVFFPAVTGIEVGTSLSGDLKDPSKSIPLGTIASILFTSVIYILVVIWFAFNSTVDQLINDNLAMQRIATIPVLILAGVWASTLSSALGSVLAAPRTLQAIARDRVVPEWIGSQMGSKTEPRMAVLLTGVIAVGIIWIGDLDFVAPIISMFFLNTYGMVNLAAGIEKLVSNPSFRPRFRVPWWVSFLGALGCYGAMFLINTPATIFAIVSSIGLFFVLQRRRIRRTWGDVRSGIWFTLARFALLNLSVDDWHAKNWRPNIIVFTGQPHNRQQLAEMADWLCLGQGIVTFFQLIIGDSGDKTAQMHRQSARRLIRNYIEENHMEAFAEAEIVPDFRQGARILVQSHGVGVIQANAILMGWSRSKAGRTMHMNLMRDVVGLEKSVLLLSHEPEVGFGKRRVINIWWKGLGGNEDLMLLLAHVIRQHHTWKRAEIRLLRMVEKEAAVEDTLAHMNKLLQNVRVDAKPVVFVRPKDCTFAQVIEERSKEADLTLLGMHLPEAEDAEEYAERLDTVVQSVGTVLLVRNAQVEEDILVAE